ncbi:MAG: IS3 family transposase, partial [Chloroflexi bacterium]|nr:IS3 family transposase [Chloroflexota bacterium]
MKKSNKHLLAQPALKYQFIAEHHQEYAVTVMCDALEVSVSGFYAWRKREPSQHSREDAERASQIKDAFQDNRGIYGSPRIHAELQAQGWHCARKRVARLMQELGLAANRPRHRTVTTRSEEGATFAPNLLQQDFHADEPNQKWVSDTTYIWTQEGWLFLAVVLDLFSRMGVGWSMAAIQDATLVINALKMALARRCPQAGFLVHSDRGSTYTSESYLAFLQQNSIEASMSRTANCYDNAAAESFFHS